MPAGTEGRAVYSGGWLVYVDSLERLLVARGNKTGDFYSCPGGESAWSALSPVPQGPSMRPPWKGCRGVTDGRRHVYVTKGNRTREFWRYDALSDSWVRLADVLPGPSGLTVKGGGDLAYVTVNDTGFVYLLKGYRTDFMRYCVPANSWEGQPAAPFLNGHSYKEGSWLAADSGQSIYCHRASYHEFCRFDIAARAWDTHRLRPMPIASYTGKRKKLKDGGNGAWCDGMILALKGSGTQELWCYNTARDSWRERDTIPSWGRTGKRKKVRAGGDIAAAGYAWFYVLKGNKCDEVWRYIEAEGIFAGSGPCAPPASPPQSPQVAARSRVGAAQVRVSGSEDFYFVIYDMSGRRVSRARGGSGLGMSGLRAGVYFLRLKSDQVLPGSKLVVAR